MWVEESVSQSVRSTPAHLFLIWSLLSSYIFIECEVNKQPKWAEPKFSGNHFLTPNERKMPQIATEMKHFDHISNYVWMYFQITHCID